MFSRLISAFFYEVEWYFRGVLLGCHIGWKIDCDVHFHWFSGCPTWRRMWNRFTATWRRIWRRAAHSRTSATPRSEISPLRSAQLKGDCWFIYRATLLRLIGAFVPRSDYFLCEILEKFWVHSNPSILSYRGYLGRKMRQCCMEQKAGSIVKTEEKGVLIS